MKKKELTTEQKAEKATQSEFNRRSGAFVRTLKAEINTIGLQAFRYRLEYLQKTPSTPLPRWYFNHEQTVGLFSRAIDEYINGN